MCTAVSACAFVYNVCALMALCACLKSCGKRGRGKEEEEGVEGFFVSFNLSRLSSGKHLCVAAFVLCVTLMEKQSAGSQSQF